MATVFEGWFGAFKVEEIPDTFGEIKEDWANTFKGKRQKILTNLSRVINSEEDYLSKIVDRSNKEYEFVTSKIRYSVYVRYIKVVTVNRL